MRTGSTARLGARALLVAALATAIPSLAAAGASAQTAPPRTGFEQRGGASWTTHAEELEFLNLVAAGSSRVDVRQVGHSVQGRPIQLVRLGPAAPAPGRTVLFTCTQHGNEPAGREACLQLLRDLAVSDHPDVAALLSTTAVLFIPTVNPDGNQVGDRENAQGADINRDHLELRTPEGRAMGQVLADWRPAIVHDLHEFPNNGLTSDPQVLGLWPRNLNVDQQVYNLSRRLAEEFVGPGLHAAGYTTGIYGQPRPPDVDVEGEDERILRNMAGLRHAVGILVETNPYATTPAESTDPAALHRRRVASHVQASLQTLTFMLRLGDQVAQQTLGARERKTQEGLTQSAPVYFRGADNRPPLPGHSADPPPCGYLLTPAQAEGVQGQLVLHTISTQPHQGEVLVPMAQAAEPVIPLLLDPRARFNLVDARALDHCPAPS
jgi:hypothetical protein